MTEQSVEEITYNELSGKGLESITNGCRMQGEGIILQNTSRPQWREIMKKNYPTTTIPKHLVNGWIQRMTDRVIEENKENHYYVRSKFIGSIDKNLKRAHQDHGKWLYANKIIQIDEITWWITEEKEAFMDSYYKDNDLPNPNGSTKKKKKSKKRKNRVRDDTDDEQVAQDDSTNILSPTCATGEIDSGDVSMQQEDGKTGDIDSIACDNSMDIEEQDTSVITDSTNDVSQACQANEFHGNPSGDQDCQPPQKRFKNEHSRQFKFKVTDNVELLAQIYCSCNEEHCQMCRIDETLISSFLGYLDYLMQQS